MFNQYNRNALFVLRFNFPVNNFRSCWDGATASGVETSTLGELNMSCLRTQDGATSWNRTRDLSIRNL